MSMHTETGVGRGNYVHDEHRYSVGPYKKSMSRVKKILRSLRIGAGVGEACTLAGIAPSTLTMWFDNDQRLKARVYDILDSRVWLIEDKMFVRLISGEASPAEYFFYLKNRMPERWNIEGNGGKPDQQYLQLVLNKILFIIGDSVKDESVKKMIADKLYELGAMNEVKVPKQVVIDGEYVHKRLERTIVEGLPPTTPNGHVPGENKEKEVREVEVVEGGIV